VHDGLIVRCLCDRPAIQHVNQTATAKRHLDMIDGELHGTREHPCEVASTNSPIQLTPAAAESPGSGPCTGRCSPLTRGCLWS
jgi:hypothetical protein